jgi:hypothetical protein
MPEWQPELPGNEHEDVRSHVLIAANMAITAFWDISSFVLEVGRRFRDAYCRHNLISVMTEAVCTPETSTYFNEIARRYIPEVCNLRKQKTFRVHERFNCICPHPAVEIRQLQNISLRHYCTRFHRIFFLPEMSCFTKVIRFLRFHSKTSKYIIVFTSTSEVDCCVYSSPLSITFAH